MEECPQESKAQMVFQKVLASHCDMPVSPQDSRSYPPAANRCWHRAHGHQPPQELPWLQLASWTKVMSPCWAVCTQ